MADSIISLLPNSPYANIRELIETAQSKYPKHWFYKPVGIEVEVTNKCNLKCAGCGQRDEAIRPEDVLTTEEYIDAILQASNTPIFACSITGGETLLFLERVKQIIRAVNGKIDLYKINTNSYRFVTDETTVKILNEFKEAGFGQKNKLIKPVFVTSIGQQNENGMSLKNSVHLVKNFYTVFDPQKATVTVNSTDKNLQKANYWLKAFRTLYKEMTGEAVDEKIVPFRKFMLNNVSTLERLKLMIKVKSNIRKLIDSFQFQYKSWKCLNLLPVDVEADVTSLTPRCVLRPNGDLYSCPGYNYTHRLGNLKEESFEHIIARANKNPLLKAIFTKGLAGLLEYAQQFEPNIEEELLSLSYGPCDVCQFLTNKIQKYSTPSLLAS